MADMIEYDIIVVGGGHAGAEAAAASSRMGAKTLLITMSLEAIGRMSCNPAIGGIGKGQIAREIDALGGLMGRVTDLAGIQFRMLNKRKGPAVWSPRAQCDRILYSNAVREDLESIRALSMRADMVTDLLISSSGVEGVRTRLGRDIRSRAVILTNGTFMNGTIHVGEKQFGGGRMGETPSIGLTATLLNLGFESGRLKTGTPPRIDGRTIDYNLVEEQPGDPQASPFSFMTDALPTRQRSCWLTYTNLEVHDLLRTGFDRSPMFAGKIDGQGPRYCPSIEEKIVRFADKNQHQLFLEPEGWKTYEVYVNGFSTSLPEDVQIEALRKTKGLEHVHLIRPGYAIEYDYFPPYQIRYSLETKNVDRLYFAGQINGTTGYEEAAAQGLMAGINAARQLLDKDPIILRRDQAYIGVLIDDLVAKGTDEPYRMFTSRAEHRILLRQDNADRRLTPVGFECGLADEARMRRMEKRSEAMERTKANIERENVSPDAVNLFLEDCGTTPITQPERIARLAVRPQISLSELIDHLGRRDELVIEAPGVEASETLVEIELKYAGYLEREKDLVAKTRKLESRKIPNSFDFGSVTNISIEARQKLSRIRPENIGQASRISGVSPADISVLLVLLQRERHNPKVRNDTSDSTSRSVQTEESVVDA